MGGGGGGGGGGHELLNITKFQLEIFIRIMSFGIHKFRENILKSSWNVSEKSTWSSVDTLLNTLMNNIMLIIW